MIEAVFSKSGDTRTFWTETVNWANANGTNTDAVLAAIDASWPATP